MAPVIHFFYKPPEYFEGKIPFIVTSLVQRLRDLNGINSEGIFRRSGSAKTVQELSGLLDKGPLSEEEWEMFSVPDVIACTLKAYLREMAKTEPLLPFDLYDYLVTISVMDDEDMIITYLRNCLKDLSSPRLILLTYLMRFFNEVSQNVSVNKMTPQNLAICIAPNILCSKIKDSTILVEENSQQNNIVRIMIQRANEVFSEVIIDNRCFMTSEDFENSKVPKQSQKMVCDMIVRWSITKNSHIPIAPPEMFCDPSFKRPSE